MTKTANLWKPSSEECRAIRAFACGEADRRHVVLRPGIRWNITDESREENTNILLVTDHPATWPDTDLADQQDWADFKRGVKLTQNGRAIVDIYVYSTHGVLLTNVTVYYGAGRILHLKAV